MGEATRGAGASGVVRGGAGGASRAVGGRGVEVLPETPAGPRLGRIVPTGIGLACMLATMPIDSAAINTFQRFAGLAAWIDAFAPAMQACALVAAIAALLCACVGALRLSDGTLAVIAAVLFVADGASIVWSAVSGAVFGGVPGGVWLLAALAAVSCLGMVLAWGRAFTRLDRLTSLWAIVCAGVARAAVGVVLTELPDAACVPFYLLAMGTSAVLVCWCAVRWRDGDPTSPGDLTCDGDAPVAGDGSAAGVRALGERVRSFIAVSWRALLGLLALALVTGMLRASATGFHLAQMGTIALGALVLGLLATRLPHNRVVSASNDIVIPLLATLLLATTDVTYALGLGETPSIALTYGLYSYAALLTLVVFGAMASAREFASDVIFSLAVGLFGLATLVGLRLGLIVGTGVVPAVTTVVTTLYAIAMVVPALVRAHAAGDVRLWGTMADVDATGADVPGGVAGDTPREGTADDDPCRAGTTAPDGVETDDCPRPAPQDREASIDRRCRELAASHGLTARETEVLGYLARGHGSAYISETLFISTNTVRTHTHNLYHKLGVSSREQIIALVCRGDAGR